jgi:hypothetical protein
MENVLGQLLNSKIDWHKTKESPYVFKSTHQGTALRLRLNDFPDEPLCTVIVDGTETDISEFPKCWTLPRHRGE